MKRAGTLVLILSLLCTIGTAYTQSNSNASEKNNTSPGQASFEVATVKPHKSDSAMPSYTTRFDADRFSATGTVRMFIRQAYGIDDNQIIGAPSWVDSETFDIKAKVEDSIAAALRPMNREQARPLKRGMVQSLLRTRFNLAVHQESRELPVFALIVAKKGPKLKIAKPGDTYPDGIKGPEQAEKAGVAQLGRGFLICQGCTTSAMAEILTVELKRHVVDRTQLSGKFDFNLRWFPDDGIPTFGANYGTSAHSGASDSNPEETGPSLFTAIQEQLGLKLEDSRGNVEVTVIDHVDRPSEN